MTTPRTARPFASWTAADAAYLAVVTARAPSRW